MSMTGNALLPYVALEHIGVQHVAVGIGTNSLVLVDTAVVQVHLAPGCNRLTDKHVVVGITRG
jgi:hypothetical protein